MFLYCRAARSRDAATSTLSMTVVLMGHKDAVTEKQIIIRHIIEEKVALKVLQVAVGFCSHGCCWWFFLVGFVFCFGLAWFRSVWGFGFFFKAKRHKAKKINHEGNSWSGVTTFMVVTNSIIVSSMNNGEALLI